MLLHYVTEGVLCYVFAYVAKLIEFHVEMSEAVWNGYPDKTTTWLSRDLRLCFLSC